MNLGIIAPVPDDGTSFYRAHGPFSYLARETGLRLIRHAEWGWAELLECDCLFLQRPYTEAHRHVVESAKVCGVPVWVDYDDYLPAIPLSNPTHHLFGSEACLKIVQRCCELADVVTVTTEPMKALRSDAVAIPNALNTYLWGMSDSPRENVITWRGGRSHWADMEPFIWAMESISHEHPHWKWHFLGHPHWSCEGIGQINPFTDLFSYMSHFKALSPSIHVVPLADNEFNRAKSNIAWLEATAAGAVVIAPDWPEWRMPGVLNYSSAESFRDAVEQTIVAGPDNRKRALEHSRKFIDYALRLSIVNRQRLEILKRFAP